MALVGGVFKQGPACVDCSLAVITRLLMYVRRVLVVQVYITMDEQGRTKGKAAIDVVGAQVSAAVHVCHFHR